MLDDVAIRLVILTTQQQNYVETSDGIKKNGGEIKSNSVLPRLLR